MRNENKTHRMELLPTLSGVPSVRVSQAGAMRRQGRNMHPFDD